MDMSVALEFERWIKTTTDTRARITHLYLWLVEYAVVRYYFGKNQHEAQDLFQAGGILLFRAVDGYDPSKGSFANYANWSLKGIIEMARNLYAAKQKEIAVTDSSVDDGEDYFETYIADSPTEEDTLWHSLIASRLPKRYGARYQRQPNDDGPHEAFGRALLRREIASGKGRSPNDSQVDDTCGASASEAEKTGLGAEIIPSVWRPAWIRKVLMSPSVSPAA
jgi:RNA polymerase sigma factor (sigma-70 family)